MKDHFAEPKKNEVDRGDINVLWQMALIGFLDSVVFTLNDDVRLRLLSLRLEANREAQERFLGGAQFPINYDEYLNSAEWKQCRQDLIRKAGNRCEVCGEIFKIRAETKPQISKSLHVHHRSYKRYGGKFWNSPDNVVVLCVWCHSFVHPETDMAAALFKRAWPQGARLKEILESLCRSEGDENLKGAMHKQ